MEGLLRETYIFYVNITPLRIRHNLPRRGEDIPDSLVVDL